MRVLAVAIAAIAIFGGQQGQRFQTGTDAVRVDVLVTDGNRPITGLTAADFVLLDDKVPQQIESVVIEDVPISMMLALDTSGSVAGRPLSDLKNAARAALGTLDPRDRASLLTFAADLTRGATWTSRVQDIVSAIESTEAGGGTSLYDAAFAAMTARDTEPGRRSLVLCFSDGDDTASWLPPTAVVERARRTDAVVYGISIAARGDRSDYRLMYRSGIELTRGSRPDLVSQPLLEELADITGGQSLRAEHTGGLADVFVRIVREFRSRYLLTYTPRGVDAGGWHTIDVRLKNRRGDVRARRGYLR